MAFQFSWTKKGEDFNLGKCDPTQYDSLRVCCSNPPNYQDEVFVPLDFSHGLDGPDHQQQQQTMSNEARVQLTQLETLAKELYTSANAEQRKRAEEMLKAETLSGESLKKLQVFLKCSQSEYLAVNK